MGLALSIVIAAALVALLEIYARVAGKGPKLQVYKLFVPDPDLLFRGKPGLKIRIRDWSGAFTCDYAHNREGFRDTDHVEPKPAGTFRILCLGDSFTYGVGAEQGDTYPARLEKLLNQRPGSRPRAEVLNLGLPAYFAKQERILLTKMAPRYEPDLVLVGFLGNHVVDASLGMDTFGLSSEGYILFHETKVLGRAGDWLHRQSRLVQWLLKKKLKRKRKQAFREKHPNDRKDLYRDNGSFETGWQRVEEEYGLIARTARASGARCAIVYIPEIDFMDPASSYAEERLQAFCAREKIAFIPTLSAFRNAPGNKRFYFPDGHLTPEGYIFIAETASAAIGQWF